MPCLIALALALWLGPELAHARSATVPGPEPSSQPCGADCAMGASSQPGFPGPANCECQAAVHTTLTNVPVDLGPLGTVVGNVTIDATICPDCALRDSTLSLQFQDGSPGDQSFAFQADPFQLEDPVCIIEGSPGQLTVSGGGTKTPATGSPEPVTFTAMFDEQRSPGQVDSLQIALRDSGGTVFGLTAPVPSASLEVQPCVTQPAATSSTEGLPCGGDRLSALTAAASSR